MSNEVCAIPARDLSWHLRNYAMGVNTWADVSVGSIETLLTAAANRLDALELENEQLRIMAEGNAWVSVDRELPPRSGVYWVIIRAEDYVLPPEAHATFARYDIPEQNRERNGYWTILDEAYAMDDLEEPYWAHVTHWMPEPEGQEGQKIGEPEAPKQEVSMVLYEVKAARIRNDGTVVEGRRKQLYQTSQRLAEGGLYYLRPGKLYRVLRAVPIKE